MLPAGNVFALAIAPSSPETLYAGGYISRGAGPNMFVTVDGGHNWTPLSAAPWCNQVLVDPANANVVFIGAGGPYRSTDGGQTWEGPFDGGDGFHGGMAISADGSKLLLGSEFGAWLATDLTSANLTLTNLNPTLATSLLLGTAIHPTNPNIGLAGSQSNGVDLYFGTMSWQYAACDDGGADAAFDFINPSTIYITCAEPPGSQKSTDGGQTFSTAQNGIDASEFMAGAYPALAMDPTDSQRLYLAATHVWQSNDGATTWTSISGALGGVTANYQALAVAASDPNTVYLGNSAGVYVSTNAKSGSGATWANISAGLPLNLAQCNYYGPTCVYFTRIAVDFSNPSTAYATFASNVSGRVYKTVNGGGSWTDISGDLPNLKVNDIAIDPDLPNTLYIATERGVYSTADGGNTWNLLGTGLPNVTVTGLKLHRPTRILRAATFGRSAWDLQLGAVASPVALSATSLSFPNQGPAQTVTLTNNGTAPLTLYSVTAPSGFAQGNNCGIQIPAGGNCSITVSFVSNVSDTYSGNITLIDDAPGEPQLLAVTGTGTGPADFDGSISPGVATASFGQTANFTLTFNSVDGVNGNVSLACSNLPSGAACTFDPASPALPPDGSVTDQLSVQVNSTVQDGAYPFTVLATVGAIAHQIGATFVYTPPGLSGSVSPASATLSVGQSANFSITLNSQNGATGNVSLACLNVPSGSTCAFSSTTVNLPANGTASDTLTVQVNSRPTAAPPLMPTRWVPPQARPETFLGFAGLLLAALIVVAARGGGKRRLAPLVVLLLAAALSLIVTLSCGGGGGRPPVGPAPPSPVLFAITVQASGAGLSAPSNIGTLTITVD